MKTFFELNKKDKVEVFCIAYNEEFILPTFINNFYKHFGASITIFDNQSTDNTVKIAKDFGCTVKTFDANNQINDAVYLQIKNHVWKNSKADWVIIVDADEFLEVPFACENYSIINTKGYDVVGDLTSRTGAPNPAYNKACMFRPNCFKEINYTPGCHNCKPVGEISGSLEFATLLHRKYISEEHVYKKHLEYEKRLSTFNKRYGFGMEYENVTQEKIRNKFLELKQNAIQIP